MADEEKPKDETEFDRRQAYRKLRAGGMQDVEAREKVWPSTTAGLNKNIKEKAERDEKAAQEAKEA